MFLENRLSGLYLWKKSSGKTFLVKVDNDRVTEKNIKELTKKEVLHIATTIWYLRFKEETYDDKMLEELLFQSKLLYNYIEASRLNIDFEHEVVLKSATWISWMQEIFPKEFIYNSNHIEWSRIPKEEVEKIIRENKYKHKIKNEIQEVRNSLKAWNFLQENFVFNIANIKKLYHVLTKDLLQETGERYPRGFKKIPNIAGINSMTTAPENVESEMKALITSYQSHKKKVFSLQLAFDFHLKYEQIHPFENGNWRTGRLLMNKILMQNGMLPMIVFTDNKRAYSNAIASCSKWRMKKYYKFMLEQYKKTLDNYSKVSNKKD